MNQYSRRENIELQNIPESVVQDDLEKFVINLLKEIKLDISSYDLVAVHRLGKPSSRKSTNVIVRFLNRKSAFACLLNAKLLGLFLAVLQDGHFKMFSNHGGQFTMIFTQLRLK